MSSLTNLTVITGGARSGKSALAERLALEIGSEKVLYVATMPRVDGDDELDYRIERHRTRRPAGWHTLEAESGLPSRLAEFSESFDVCIMDCLSLYISNILFESIQKDESHRSSNESEKENTPDASSRQFVRTELERLECLVAEAIEDLLSMIAERQSQKFIVVTNEVGWSVVPENGMARAYRDLLGFANQRIARPAAYVFLCCAGLELALKGSTTGAFVPRL